MYIHPIPLQTKYQICINHVVDLHSTVKINMRLTEEAIKNGQSRETDNTGHRRGRPTKQKCWTPLYAC
jgi:hypothetical protein